MLDEIGHRALRHVLGIITEIMQANTTSNNNCKSFYARPRTALAGFCNVEQPTRRTQILDQLLKQCLRVLEVFCLETFGEPAVIRSKQVMGFGTAAPLAEMAGQAHSGA
jgi:hypothetical protein